MLTLLPLLNLANTSLSLEDMQCWHATLQLITAARQVSNMTWLPINCVLSKHKYRQVVVDHYRQRCGSSSMR